MANKIFYFGCIGEPGHFMHRPSGYRDWDVTTPWGKTPDGALCLGDTRQVEGQALLHHKDGWTAIGFWDRSVDRRGGSNSNFLALGTLTFDEILALARETFPQVFRRITFDIVEVPHG